MKKIAVIGIVLIMLITCFTGCGETEAPKPAEARFRKDILTYLEIEAENPRIKTFEIKDKEFYNYNGHATCYVTWTGSSKYGGGTEAGADTFNIAYEKGVDENWRITRFSKEVYFKDVGEQWHVVYDKHKAEGHNFWE